jgi:hypothetical protein
MTYIVSGRDGLAVPGFAGLEAALAHVRERFNVASLAVDGPLPRPDKPHDPPVWLVYDEADAGFSMRGIYIVESVNADPAGKLAG